MNTTLRWFTAAAHALFTLVLVSFWCVVSCHPRRLLSCV